MKVRMLCLVFSLLLPLALTGVNRRAVAQPVSGVIHLPRTGQVSSYYPGDDGDLQAGVAWPDPRFTVSGDCMADNLTGLTWVKSPDPGAKTWSQALAYAEGLERCGYSDWRLPNAHELESLVKGGEAELSYWLNGQGFSVGYAARFWSSTPCAGRADCAWYLHLEKSYLAMMDKDNPAYLPQAWAVRGGPAGPVGANLAISPAAHDYGRVFLGQSASHPFTVTNTGDGSLSVFSVAISGADAADYAVHSQTCTAAPIAPGGTCTAVVVFSPQAESLRQAALCLTSNAPASPRDVALSGTGTVPGAYGWIDITDHLTATFGIASLFFGGQQGWIGGWRDSVHYTPDGGQTFTIQSFEADPYCVQYAMSIFIRSLTDGYLVTNCGRVFHSDDPASGGWTELGYPGGLMTSIDFPPLPAETGYAVSQAGEIYRVTSSTLTLDLWSGAIWDSVSVPENPNEAWVAGGMLFEVFFLNPREGWAVGTSTLLHTTDGGQTWNEEAAGLTEGKLRRAVYAVDSNTVYVGGNGAFLKYGPIELPKKVYLPLLLRNH